MVVARAGRQIDDEDIQLAQFTAPLKLLNRLSMINRGRARDDTARSSRANSGHAHHLQTENFSNRIELFVR